ncbi:hypothetical protein [Tsuneonella suprasediminis]|uniref:hypothetical protein n=1 Tax=Tsuneonella suprasediminis TaxID=2306996 RepID=UPI002F928311
MKIATVTAISFAAFASLANSPQRAPNQLDAGATTDTKPVLDRETWLSQHPHPYTVASIGEASVYWLGFFPRESLAPEQLAELDKAALMPGFLDKESEFADRQPNRGNRYWSGR